MLSSEARLPRPLRRHIDQGSNAPANFSRTSGTPFRSRSLLSIGIDGEPAYRRDSVRPRPDERQRTGVAIHLSGLPGKRPFSGTGRAARLPRLALLRVGFTEPAGSPPSLVRSYRTFSPLPVRSRHPGAAIGGLLSVALSCESPRLASPAPCSAESRPSSTRSRLAPVRAAATRPTHRRFHSATPACSPEPGSRLTRNFRAVRRQGGSSAQIAPRRRTSDFSRL